MGSIIFRCAYRIYLTGIGRNMHEKGLNRVRQSNIHPHSKYSESQGAPQFIYGDIQVIPVPYLEDNLAYIVLKKSTGSYFLIDPADFQAIEEVKEAYQITGAPQAVFVTHKHWDHASHN